MVFQRLFPVPDGTLYSYNLISNFLVLDIQVFLLLYGPENPPDVTNDTPYTRFLASASTSSVAFWLIIIVGTTGNAPGTTGSADPSTTLSPSTPRTRNLLSSTAIGFLSPPIAQLDVA